MMKKIERSKRKKYGILVGILAILIGILFSILILSKQEEKEEIEPMRQSQVEIPKIPEVVIDQNQIAYQENSGVEELKEDYGIQGDKDLYEIKTEYDGRKVLSVKQSIQYQIALAGILKQEKPIYSEVDKLIEQAPRKTGIWIPKESQEPFLALLKSGTDTNYFFDEENYLQIAEETNLNSIDQILKNKIQGQKQYCLSFSGKIEMIDTVTGKIEEYPFETMDPYQPYEYVQNKSQFIICVTQNKQKKLNDLEILEAILKVGGSG